jgi:hypothetical protein
MQHGLSAASARSAAYASSTSLPVSDFFFVNTAPLASIVIASYKVGVKFRHLPDAKAELTYLPLPVRRLTRHLFSRLGDLGRLYFASTHVRLQSHKKLSGSILRARAYEMTTKNHVFKHLARPSLFAHPPR